jgi:hypothetical protein
MADGRDMACTMSLFFYITTPLCPHPEGQESRIQIPGIIAKHQV